MSKMKQSDAVVAAVTTVLANAGIGFEEGQNAHPLLTKELRSQVAAILFEGFKSETIDLKTDYDDAQLRKYIPGLVTNHVGKDKRLNGGVNHKIKNPGSRAGSSDPQIKALRALMSNVTDESERAEIQVHIDARLQEIGETKAKKTVKVNYEDLPEDLKAKYGA